MADVTFQIPFTVLLSADILLALSKTINDFQVVLKRISSVDIFLLYYITPGLDNFPPFARTRSSFSLRESENVREERNTYNQAFSFTFWRS